MKSLDYLYNSDIKIYQDDTMFKMNSDTRNLGDFLELRKNDYTILDVGCNNGALLLYAMIKNKAKHYYGVDVNDKALNLAKENMLVNNVSNFTFFNVDFRELKMEQVDYIVTNPPYFDGDHVSENIDKRRARFAEFLPTMSITTSQDRSGWMSFMRLDYITVFSVLQALLFSLWKGPCE